ncbi:MAG: permease prefix domain 1-containing protein [Candidatus Limnocylindria bacterium]
MPERDLSERWFVRLHDALALPGDERTDAIEEIRAHVELAADEMVARGVSREAGTRRVLERLGAPDRLARDITAAHRRPSDLLTAGGVALRVTAVTGLKALVVAWAGVALLAVALNLGVAATRRFVGSQFLQNDWSQVLDGLIPAAVGALVAYAVGRSLVTPVAIAAHRSRSEIRWVILAIGLTVATAIALTAVEARWSVPTALAMASLPAWFALGVLRPALLPSWRLPGRGAVVLILALLVALPLMLFAAGGQPLSSGQSFESEAFDPNVAYAAVGPFVDMERPPLDVIETTESAGPWSGPGPIRIERSGTFVTGDADQWTGLRLEVWQGLEDELNGNVLDPQATAPLATAPMTTAGTRVHGSVELLPEPRRSFYYVAITGMTAAGERVQLAWPGIEWWQWRGTAYQFFEALVR